MAKSIWDTRNKRQGPKPAKAYESNAEHLLQVAVGLPRPRELRAQRVEAEVRLYNKNDRRLPTIAELQTRHNFTEEAAASFLRSVQRKIRERERRTASVAPEKPMAFRSPPPAQQPTPPTTPESTPTPSPLVAGPSAALFAVLADIRRRFGDEIRTRGEQTVVKEGFVYLAVHPCFDGWVKAGMTIDYELRLASYNTSDPLSRFAFVSAKWVPDRRQAEKLLLEYLAGMAEEMRGEWARVSVVKALEALGRV
ncbi:GIY-YIG nuclease family protein [Hydrogenophaga defluvii]|uniref:GIY-YIG nuclease family protein n=1 Tax=Hydrogenophaga defluvii TaxID=249410 RepID=A0ABW2SGN5_9BURK